MCISHINFDSSLPSYRKKLHEYNFWTFVLSLFSLRQDWFLFMKCFYYDCLLFMHTMMIILSNVITLNNISSFPSAIPVALNRSETFGLGISKIYFHFRNGKNHSELRRILCMHFIVKNPAHFKTKYIWNVDYWKDIPYWSEDK